MAILLYTDDVLVAIPMSMLPLKEQILAWFKCRHRPIVACLRPTLKVSKLSNTAASYASFNKATLTYYIPSTTIMPPPPAPHDQWPILNFYVIALSPVNLPVLLLRPLHARLSLRVSLSKVLPNKFFFSSLPLLHCRSSKPKIFLQAHLSRWA